LNKRWIKSTKNYWIKQYLSEHPEPSLARLLCSGPIVDVPGGRPHSSYGILIISPEDARDKTNYLLDAGVDLIKVYLEDGSIMNESWEVISLEELQAIVEVAHSRGTIVTAHVQEAYLVERALDGGVDDIAHSQLDELVPYPLIDRMIAEDVYLIPTLEIYLVLPQKYRHPVKFDLLHDNTPQGSYSSMTNASVGDYKISRCIQKRSYGPGFCCEMSVIEPTLF